MQQVILTGRLGSDVEEKEKYLTFSFCVNVFDKGEKKPQWYRVLVFKNSNAINRAAYLKKGSQATIVGDLNFVDIYHGNKGASVSLQVLANSLYFVESGERKERPVKEEVSKADFDGLPF